MTGRPGEFELISRYFAPLATDPGSLSLTDDAATIPGWPGEDIVLTKDMLAADVHFFANDPAEAIAAKALRVNLSDLAAKGARARGYLLGLALAPDWDEAWLKAFTDGLASEQAAFRVALYGGDTIRTGDRLMISITAIGSAPSGAAVRRSGARPGDEIYVTGTIGDAALGLLLRLEPAFASRLGLSQTHRSHLLDRYLLPQPRVTLAGLLRDYANAAMDVSDGLLADLGHMCRASGCDAVLEVERTPLSEAARCVLQSAPDMLGKCLSGGDDYEILAAVSPGRSAAFLKAVSLLGVPVTRIGNMKEGVGQVWPQHGGEAFSCGQDVGFSHF